MKVLSFIHPITHPNLLHMVSVCLKKIIVSWIGKTLEHNIVLLFKLIWQSKLEVYHYAFRR